MSNAQRKALTTHRNRRRDSGVVRVEVQAAALDTWPDKVRAGFGGRILPVEGTYCALGSKAGGEVVSADSY